ncbi:MAG: shikimate kinase [Elainella sp. C42_A2020_010]|nr:shikimate kinase [Elainella sp. C42_A2020_010]RNJ71110.1 MAG: shikimate kinase [Leptolyngbya sp. IPPAS B-1204]
MLILLTPDSSFPTPLRLLYNSSARFGSFQELSTLSTRLRGTNLYLIGMMGAGKSTVGQLLARSLGYRFFDTDTLIERVAGQSISQIFASMGEAEFRQLETQVLAQLSAYTRSVIATGGGIVSQPQNWSYLQHGVVVWLNVPIEVLYQRIKHDTTRPLLQTDDPLAKLQLLLQERRPFYAQADVEVTVGAGDSAEQVAARMIEAIPLVLRPETK